VFHSPLFRKLLISAFVLIAATLVGLDFFLTRYIADRETQSVQHRLTAEARILREEVPDVASARLEVWAKEVSRRAQARFTMIEPGGTVVADSEHDPETMENHANRPEIRQAYAGQVGVAIRRSATLNRDLCYVAVGFPYRGATGFVLRLAVPLEEVNSAVAAVRWWLMGASLSALGGAMVIAYIFSEPFASCSRLRNI
jgi:two-component system phosphate regulon sensor histidine kinase PhoR